jgi:hypothetical protein
VHPALLVLGIKAGVVGAPGAAGIREDEDALGPPMKALASASDWLAVRDSSRWLPSGKVTSRRVRPVISATASVPKREMIASSAGTIGGSAPSSSSVSALIRSASCECTGLPASSTIGRERSLPSSSQ